MDDVIHAGLHPGSGWTSIGHGVQVRADRADDLVHQLRAWQLVLPYWSSFTGLTAASLRGWWLPPLPAGLPLFVATGRSDRLSRPGLLACRHDELPGGERHLGVRLTSAAETILALARDLSLLDVVVIGDSALHRGDVTLAELWRVARLRRRGAPLLRSAIPLMDGRAESIYEGLLRMLHVACDVAVEPQYVVLDDDGVFVARADLLLVGTERLAEYDGGTHLERRQQRRDLRRTGRIEDAGYERRGYTQEDLLRSGATVLRDADRALRRPHDPSRLRAWHELLRQSLFTDAGQERLVSKLRLS
jgi:hypothetical protein